MPKAIEKQASGVVRPIGLTTLIVRSMVQPVAHYREYKQIIRYDFFYSCAYCTIAESEASALRFTIDHYEPQKTHPNLRDEYGNLLYCCDHCNIKKGPRNPTDAQKAKGYRFFRPDQDLMSDHFDCPEIRLIEKTPVGYYTLHALDLNRGTLIQLRKARRKLVEYDKSISEKIDALRNFPIDRLPAEIRAQAARTIRALQADAEGIVKGVDELLREASRSHNSDEDLESEDRSVERKRKLDAIPGLAEGNWHSIKVPSRKRGIF